MVLSARRRPPIAAPISVPIPSVSADSRHNGDTRKAAEFVRFVLSQEGQDCIQREGRYMPLTPEFVQEQLKKLE